jgi:hypothetical protein
MQAKARRRITDLVHKATRQVSDAFPGATCYVGEPFNGAAQDMAPCQAQTVSQACNARIIGQLAYNSLTRRAAPFRSTKRIHLRPAPCAGGGAHAGARIGADAG